MTADAGNTGHGDGRAARRQRTRGAIVAAATRPIESGNLSPTSRQISGAAGVAERTLFLHFTDLEDLRAAVAAEHLARTLAAHHYIDPALPLAERLRAFAGQRGDVLEAMTPLRLSAIATEADSPALQASRARWTDLATAEVASVFRNELGTPPDPAVLSTLAVLTSWAAWHEWRTGPGLAVAAARSAMAYAIATLLRATSDAE